MDERIESYSSDEEFQRDLAIELEHIIGFKPSAEYLKEAMDNLRTFCSSCLD